MIKPITKFPTVVYAIRDNSHGMPAGIEIINLVRHKESQVAAYIFEAGFYISNSFKAKSYSADSRFKTRFDKAIENDYRLLSSMSKMTKARIFRNIFDSYNRVN